MICINLTDRVIVAEMKGGNEVTLTFEGDEAYFYLLFIGLVARQMKEIARSKDAMPFVDLKLIKDDTMALDQAIQPTRPRDFKTLASTMYQTWHRRLHPEATSGQCVFQFKGLLGDQNDEVASMFEKESGRAGERARYRIGRPVSMITIKGAELLDELLSGQDVGSSIPVNQGMPHQIPHKPYYSGLEVHESLVRTAFAEFKGNASGSPLLVWGMGGLGKTTLAAEIARRYVQAENHIGVLWVQLRGPDCESPSEAGSLRAYVASTVISQLGLFDMLHAPPAAMLAQAAKSDILPQCLLVIDDFHPQENTISELAAVVEEIGVKRVIVTSRVSLDMQHSQEVKVPPLGSKDGVCFLRTDAAKRGIASALPKRDGALIKMCEATGGLPFALQLAIGQATRLPWRTVLERRAAGGTDLYRYLFRESWKMLGTVAHKTLIYMRTSPDEIELEELLACDEIGSADQIAGAVDELVKMALLDVRSLDEQSAVYAIHPLTRSFITTDLPRMWSEEDGNMG